MQSQFDMKKWSATHQPGDTRAIIDKVIAALKDQGVGTIGEIFDGDPPHHPRGAPAQAWSVACTLDAWRLLKEARSNTREASDGATH